MKSVTATESEVRREGVKSILLKAGLDPDKVTRTEKRDCLNGEIIYAWTEINREAGF